jgi:hypothetical protein
MFIDRWWKTGSLGIFVRLKSSEMQQRRGEKLWFCRQHGKSNKRNLLGNSYPFGPTCRQMKSWAVGL